MTKITQQFNLSNFTVQPDGSYKKNSTSVQPRDLRFPLIVNDISINGKIGVSPAKVIDSSPKKLRKITLNLFGEPMPKQSVRSFIKNGKIMHFQPKILGDRTKDYIKQIKEQLPKDFVMFEERVYVTKMHFIFAPLKAFHKIKGRMDAIRNGEIFYKATRPDLPDNLKKLVNDSMSELVFRDDSIIVSEDNVKKYFGIGGCIIIEMSGY